MKHFLHISDYSNSELWEILKLAKKLILLKQNTLYSCISRL